MGLQTEIAELKANIWKQPPDYKETVLWQDDLRFAKQIIAKMREVVEGAEVPDGLYLWAELEVYKRGQKAMKQAIKEAMED